MQSSYFHSSKSGLLTGFLKAKTNCAFDVFAKIYNIQFFLMQLIHRIKIS